MIEQTEHQTVSDVVNVALDLGKLTRRKTLRPWEIEQKAIFVASLKALVGRLEEEAASV